MKLRQLRTHLRHELCQNQDLFEEACARHEALGEHTTVMAVLGVLDRDDTNGYAARDAIVRAILHEYQRGVFLGGPGQLGVRPTYWTSVLLAAFYPMLSRLRFRIVSRLFDADDLDQLVIESFLDVAKKTSPTARSSVTRDLRCNTGRLVFNQVRDAEREQRADDDLAEEAVGDPDFIIFSGPRPSNDVNGDEVEPLAELLVAHCGTTITSAELDLVVATALQGEGIRSYVGRLHPHANDAEREQIYQRLKRQRHRTSLRIRTLLEAVMHDERVRSKARPGRVPVPHELRTRASAP